MPLKRGHSREVVSSNIHEMVKSGYKPKQAIAAALASSRKYKKMADGGKVMEGYDFENLKHELGMGSSSESESPSSNAPHDPDKGKAEAFEKGMGYADGGQVVGVDDYSGLFERMHVADQGAVSSPEQLSDRQKLAKALLSDEQYAMGGFVEVDGDETPSDIKSKTEEPMSVEEDSMYAKGGLVEGMDGDETPSNIVSSTSEPMSDEPQKPGLEHSIIEGVPMSQALSKEAIEALKAKKMKRRFAR